MTATYQITANTDVNGWEIRFDEKPATTIREALKALGMRWHSVKQCWYISQQKATDSQITAAILGASDPDEAPAEVVTDGYMGGGAVYGSKSHLGLYGADLTAAIRTDLKKAGLKGITVRQYHGGSGIAVTATITPADLLAEDEYAKIWEPSGWWIDTPNGSIRKEDYYTMTAAEQSKVRADAAKTEITRYRTTEQSINHHYIDDYTAFTPAYRDKLKSALAIVNQYHYDESNSMVDYFDTNFYLSLYIKPGKTH